MDKTLAAPTLEPSFAAGPTPTGAVVASSQDDAAAVNAVMGHHAELAGALAVHVDALVAAAGAVASTGMSPVDTARNALGRFCDEDLLPHAAAEEAALYPAAATQPRAQLLIEAMLTEHRILHALIQQVHGTGSPIGAAGAASALRVLFDAHLAKENDLILPLVAADPTTSLAEILAGMHELLGGSQNDTAAAPAEPNDHRSTTAEAHQGGACGCSTALPGADLVLDVTQVPHAIRHATVFGAVSAVPTGCSLVLVATHDPLPLLRQLEDREPGAFVISYDQRGPQAWRVRLTRTP